MTFATPKISFAPLLAALCLLSACSLEPRIVEGGDGAEHQRNAYTPPVGIQTFRQALESRVVLTNVNPNPSNPADPILVAYNRASGLFSMDGDALTVSAPMIMAYGSLSAAFCQAVVAQERSAPLSSRKLFAAVDFTAGPGGFTPSSRRQVARVLFQRFLQRDPRPEESAIVAGAMEETLAGVAPNDGNALTEALIVGCTLTLASLQSWAE